ncbi:MAG TPA: peptidase U62, partial [Candidatus Angelobacter sp.]|nr:peptidase U62 [Candidatus Angelobacter sp.]
MRRLISILLLLVFSVAAFAGDNTTPAAATVSSNDHGDAVLKAMLAELKRSQEKLQLGQMQRPYYIDYQVTEIQDNIADATLGALRTDQVNRGRLVRVVVRIGDYKQDSYFGEGMGALETMPS